jgi:hypothetical protein
LDGSGSAIGITKSDVSSGARSAIAYGYGLGDGRSAGLADLNSVSYAIGADI